MGWSRGADRGGWRGGVWLGIGSVDKTAPRRRRGAVLLKKAGTAEAVPAFLSKPSLFLIHPPFTPPFHNPLYSRLTKLQLYNTAVIRLKNSPQGACRLQQTNFLVATQMFQK